MKCYKRFKVVQDALGRWGIYDAGDPWQEASFASFGGGGLIDLIVDAAVQLNQGRMRASDLAWTWYYPREDNQ